MNRVNWVKSTANRIVPLETVAILIVLIIFMQPSLLLHSQHFMVGKLYQDLPYSRPAFRSTTTCECLAWLSLQGLPKSFVCYNLPMLGLKSNSLKKKQISLEDLHVTSLCTMIALPSVRCRRHCRREGWSGQHLM